MILSCAFILLSCKKDKLEDEKAIFIGTWNWLHTEHIFNYCDGDPNSTEIITPDTNGDNYSMEFLEKGIVKYFEDGEVLKKDRIIFSNFFEDGDYYDFAINLNNDTEITGTFYGYVSVDTLIIIYGFPYTNHNIGCERYVSYFVK